MQFDDRQLQTRLARADKTLARVSRNAINDAAQEARKAVPDYLKENIDKPISFTVSAGVAKVERADSTTLKGRLFISPLQARYLAPIEHGTPSEQLIMPVIRAATSPQGNIKARFKRTAANMLKLKSDTKNQKSGYFVGSPKDGKRNTVGIFQRKGRKKFVTVALFIKRRSNSEILGIRDHWRNTIPALLMKHYEIQSSDSRNAL